MSEFWIIIERMWRWTARHCASTCGSANGLHKLVLKYVFWFNYTIFIKSDIELLIIHFIWKIIKTTGWRKPRLRYPAFIPRNSIDNHLILCFPYVWIVTPSQMTMCDSFSRQITYFSCILLILSFHGSTLWIDKIKYSEHGIISKIFPIANTQNFVQKY